MSNPFQDNENIFDQQDDEFEDFPDVGAQRSFDSNNQASPFGANLNQFSNMPSQSSMMNNSFGAPNTAPQPQAVQQFNQGNQQQSLPTNNSNVKAQQKKLYLYAAIVAVALFALIAIGVVVSNNLKTGETTVPVQTTTTLVEPTATQDNQGIQVQKKVSASDVAGIANATDNIMVGRVVSKAPMLIEANQVICELEVELLNESNDTIKIIVPSYLYYELTLNDKVDINLRFGKAVDGTDFWTVYGIKKH